MGGVPSGRASERCGVAQHLATSDVWRHELPLVQAIRAAATVPAVPAAGRRHDDRSLVLAAIVTAALDGAGGTTVGEARDRYATLLVAASFPDDLTVTGATIARSITAGRAG